MLDNKTFLAMLNNVLNTDGFYFSATYDLTHTLQRLANTSPEFQEMTLLERVRLTWGNTMKNRKPYCDSPSGSPTMIRSLLYTLLLRQ